MRKSIITVLGKDKVGIIASICNYLSNSNVNVLDISQTIVNGNFNMIMVVDLQDASETFKDISVGLENVGKSIGVLVRIQKEEIFTAMHQI